MNMRSKLSYANVTSTLALVLALGAGGAYAVDRIGSSEIKNRSIRGADVKRDTLTGRQIKESRLVGRRIVRIAGDEGGTCNPSGPAFVSCVDVTMRFKRPSIATATATGAFSNDEILNDPATARCQLQVNGDANLSEFPGEDVNTTDGLGSDGFARTVVTDELSAGLYKFRLACGEFEGASSIARSTLSVIAVTAR